jgi:DNA-binding IclR family transcriptional regulator
LHVTAVGKLMLGLAGEDEIESYARRTNLPAYTRNTLSSLSKLEEVCMTSIRQGYSLDNEEAEIGVGCIGVLLFEKSGNVSAGLSISAPIERRKNEWIGELKKAGEEISRHLGYRPG